MFLLPFVLLLLIASAVALAVTVAINANRKAPVPGANAGPAGPTSKPQVTTTTPTARPIAPIVAPVTQTTRPIAPIAPIVAPVPQSVAQPEVGSSVFVLPPNSVLIPTNHPDYYYHEGPAVVISRSVVNADGTETALELEDENPVAPNYGGHEFD
jgi:hypothetical protein